MASEGVSGIGTKFRHLVGSVWTDLAEVRGISGPSKSRETIDVTSFDSVDGYREFIGSLRDAGEVTLDLIFTAAAYDVLDGYFDSDDLVDFEILLSDPENTSFEFKGLVTAVPLEVPLDDAITFSCTIKVSAKVTIDSGSG